MMGFSSGIEMNSDRPDCEQGFFDMEDRNKHGDPTAMTGDPGVGCCICCGDRLKGKDVCSYCGFDNTEVK